MARRRKYIDRKLMKELCLAQLTNAEIARCLRVSPDTIERRYAVAIKAWRELGTGSVRRQLFSTAMGSADMPGRMTAIIFFLKNYGGMADDPAGDKKGLGFGDIPVSSEFQRDLAAEAHQPN